MKFNKIFLWGIFLTFLLVSCAVYARVDQNNVFFSAVNATSDPIVLEVKPYLRVKFHPMAPISGTENFYRATTNGLSSACGHKAEITVIKGTYCYAEVSFHIKDCPMSDAYVNVQVNNITNNVSVAGDVSNVSYAYSQLFCPVS